MIGQDRTIDWIKVHETSDAPALSRAHVGIAMGTGTLYPAFGLLLSPMIAAAAMSFSSVSVIGNALWLRKTKI